MNQQPKPHQKVRNLHVGRSQSGVRGLFDRFMVIPLREEEDPRRVVEHHNRSGSSEFWVLEEV